MSANTLVMFGAGNIGRSFIGQLFSRAEYETVFIDVNDALIDALNERREYRVIIKRNDQPDETILVKNARGVHGRDADIVEEAEAHRRCLLGVMAGRADGTEGILAFAADHQVHRHATGAGGTQGRLPGMRIHRSVGIEMDDPHFRRGALDAFEMRGRMDAQQLFEGGQRRVVVHEIGVDALGDQVIVDGGQTLRAFRVMRPHVVQLAVAMGDEGSGGHLFSLYGPAHCGALVEVSLSSHSERPFKH